MSGELPGLEPPPPPPPVPLKLTAAEVATAVRRHYGAENDGLGPEWAVLDEFTLYPGPGYQRIDLFAIRAWRSRPKGHRRVAIEIKVSRSDLLSELSDPTKRAPFEKVSHQFFLACPAGLCRLDEVPDGVGLIEVTERGCRVAVQAPLRDPAPLPPEALVEAFRRASRVEARVRNANSDDAAAELVALRAQVASYERRLDTSRLALERERTRVRLLAQFVKDGLGDIDIPCACGQANLKRHGRGALGFAHADGSTCSSRWPLPPAQWIEGRLGLPPELPDEPAD